MVLMVLVGCAAAAESSSSPGPDRRMTDQQPGPGAREVAAGVFAGLARDGRAMETR